MKCPLTINVPKQRGEIYIKHLSSDEQTRGLCPWGFFPHFGVNDDLFSTMLIHLLHDQTTESFLFIGLMQKAQAGRWPDQGYTTLAAEGALLYRYVRFQRWNCNKSRLHSFPSAVAFKTCWSWPLWCYRVRKSNCSVLLHLPPEYLNPLMQRDTSSRLTTPLSHPRTFVQKRQ